MPADLRTTLNPSTDELAVRRSIRRTAFLRLGRSDTVPSMPTPVADYLIFPAQNRTPSVKTPRRKLLFLDSDMEMKTVDPEGNVELLGAGTPGPAGPAGADGAQGPIGPAGASGSPGAAATVEVNSTTTGLPGTDAEVVNVGTSSAALLDFTIPAGEDGADGTAATIAVGTVTTGAAGSSAVITNVGTSSAATFNFTIPRGDTGATGSGAVVSMKLVTKKDTQVYTASPAVWGDVTGLSITHTLSSASNKVIAMCDLAISGRIGTNGVIWRIVRDSTPIGVGDAGGANQPRCSGGIYGPDDNNLYPGCAMAEDVPGSVGPFTYKVQVANTAGGASGFVYINRSQNDLNVLYCARGASTLTISEVTP